MDQKLSPNRKCLLSQVTSPWKKTIFAIWKNIKQASTNLRPCYSYLNGVKATPREMAENKWVSLFFTPVSGVQI